MSGKRMVSPTASSHMVPVTSAEIKAMARELYEQALRQCGGRGSIAVNVRNLFTGKTRNLVLTSNPKYAIPAIERGLAAA